MNVIATRNKRELTILLWNYHDDDLPAPASQIDLSIESLPEDLSRALVEDFRVDERHSNSYAEWKSMGSPQTLDPLQQKKLQSAGQLQLLESPRWESVQKGRLHLAINLPRPGLSAIRIVW